MNLGGSPGPVLPRCAQKWLKTLFISFHFSLTDGLSWKCRHVLTEQPRHGYQGGRRVQHDTPEPPEYHLHRQRQGVPSQGTVSHPTPQPQLPPHGGAPRSERVLGQWKRDRGDADPRETDQRGAPSPPHHQRVRQPLQVRVAHGGPSLGQDPTYSLLHCHRVHLHRHLHQCPSLMVTSSCALSTPGCSQEGHVLIQMILWPARSWRKSDLT